MSKVSQNMRQVLLHIAAGKPADTGCRGRSEFGARAGTLRALHQRGLLFGNKLTDAGLSFVRTLQAHSNKEQ